MRVIFCPTRSVKPTRGSHSSDSNLSILEKNSWLSLHSDRRGVDRPHESLPSLIHYGLIPNRLATKDDVATTKSGTELQKMQTSTAQRGTVSGPSWRPVDKWIAELADSMMPPNRLASIQKCETG